MKRYLAAAVLAATALTASACSGTSETGQQALVDRATLTLQDMVTTNVSHDPRDLLPKARAVMICPRVFKAGFLFGGSGGGCVLVGRAGNGTWSYPAFYSIGSGSFGLQAGLQDSEILLLIMTRKGLNAVLDSQIKLGAGAGLAIATFGAGVQGDLTVAGADIVAFAANRGLFAGISLEGSVMSSDTTGDQLYYGRAFAARQIVIDMQGTNPGADPLRELLTRYGTGSAPQPAYAPPPNAAPAQPGYAPAYPGPQGTPGYGSPGYGAPAYQAAPDGRGPVQEQNLAPPR